MNVNDRYKILHFLDFKKQATIHELADLCQVSLPTMRKYLSILHNDKVLIFHRGQVTQQENHIDPILGWRLNDNKNEKVIIGKKAGDLILDGETVFLGGGSTVFYILEHLISKKNLKIVTNSLHVINVLVKYPHIKLTSIGGTWKPRMKTFDGAGGNFSQCFHPDRSFVGALSVDINKGITQPQDIENKMEFDLFLNATNRYIVAGHSKFEQSYPWTILPTNQIQNIITDTLPLNIKEWNTNGVTII